MKRMAAKSGTIGSITAVVLIGVAGSPAGAGELPSSAVHGVRPRFRAEAVAITEADSSFLSLYVEADYRELGFRREPGSGLTADVDLIVHVFEDDREVIADIWSEKIRIHSREDLRGRGRRFRESLLFPLHPGLFAIEVTLAQPTAGISGRLRLGVTVPFPIPGQTRISDVLIGPCGLSGGMARLHHDVVHREDASPPGDTCVSAYVELYHPGLAFDTLGVSWRLSAQDTGEILGQARRQYPAGRGATLLEWTLPLSRQSRGAFRVEADVATPAGTERATSAFTLGGAPDIQLDLFFREHLGALEYIAEADEVEPLRMAPPEERARLWEEFWSRRDETPDDGRNEFRDEFLQRIETANARFGGLRAGWRTDRGRIYIRNGEPDDIQRSSPGDYRGLPVEVWRYDSLGRSYVFVDRQGFGDYELTSGEF